MTSLEAFLATVPILRELSPEQLQEIAPLFQEEHHPAGALILRQGQQSQAVYFLRSGQLAVRVQRPEGRETVAYLQPGALFGELSFITGRTCSADVEVVVDADVVSMSKEMVHRLPKHRETILRGMMTVVAERLHDTVTRGTRTTEYPVVLLESGTSWPATFSFAVELARSLARQTSRQTLVANLGAEARDSSMRQLDPLTCAADLALPSSPDRIRADLAGNLTRWKQRFANVVLNPVGATGKFIIEQAHPFADHHGYLLGPGEQIEKLDGKHFAVQCLEGPALSTLSGKSQLIPDCAETEKRFQSGQPATPRFLRTVDSIARCVADLQVRIALGGGAA
jgi:CRP-like cAMP-binding protein